MSNIQTPISEADQTLDPDRVQSAPRSRYPRTDKLCNDILHDYDSVKIVKLIFHAMELEQELIEKQEQLAHTRRCMDRLSREDYT